MEPPEPKGPPPKEADLAEAVFTFKDGSGAVVRQLFPVLTERQRNRVQKALATAPWRERRIEPGGRPAVDRKSELFKRTVNYEGSAPLCSN